VREFTARGYRVLAVAKEKEQRFLLVGLAALSDELREDSPALIRELAHLGVNVKMLTGDAKPVAEEVAQKLSLTGEVGEMSRLKSATAQEFADMVERTQVFAEIYPEDKYNIVKALQEKKHIVGMTGDGVNDAAALKQAEVGIAVMDATDVAKGAASAVLTVPGLEPIVEMVKTGRMVYQRIVTWIVNKLVKTFQIVVFAVLAYLVTREFVVSVFSMVLYLFLTDFLTLSLSTDRVGYSKKPDTWNVSWLVTLGLLLGALVVVESFGVLYAGFVLFRLGSEMNRLHMYVFTYLVLSGALNVLILRERRRFWRSKPSTPLLLSLIADTVLVLAISLVGVYELAPITAYEAAFTLASACIFAFTINDALKAFIIKKRGVS
jgi:H+-transporting ATPase